MKISYEWLKEYVDIKLSPEGLAEKLTMLGFESSVERKVGEHQVIEVEVTPNRADCLCVFGLAREIAAVDGSEAKVPESDVVEEGDEAGSLLSVEIESPSCSRYCGRVVTGVEVKPSPGWLSAKLEAVGFRPINNVVDITNYVLMELGHPLHAFDYDCIKGKKIVVRAATGGEKLVTLDEVERELEEGMLVIADAKRAVALAGVMGGLDTQVTADTKNVLLESAYFSPASIAPPASFAEPQCLSQSSCR